MDALEKAGQLERDFLVKHPLKALRIGLKKRAEAEVTPFQAQVAHDRIDGLTAKYDDMTYEEAMIVLLMRGARIENLNVATGGESCWKRGVWHDDTSVLVNLIQGALMAADLEALAAVSQENISLWNRS